jgi:hypothetical protein
MRRFINPARSKALCFTETLSYEREPNSQTYTTPERFSPQGRIPSPSGAVQQNHKICGSGLTGRRRH